jgi:hypothetical protein
LNNAWDGLHSPSVRNSLNVNIISEADDDGFGPSTEKKDGGDPELHGREIWCNQFQSRVLHDRSLKSPERFCIQDHSIMIVPMELQKAKKAESS